jgi:hypothetical protein
MVLCEHFKVNNYFDMFVYILLIFVPFLYLALKRYK